MRVECILRLNGKPVDNVDCFKYWGGKWHLMEDVKDMSYTE